jgi:hypothetical protein
LAAKGEVAGLSRPGEWRAPPQWATTDSWPLTMLLALLHGEDRWPTWLALLLRWRAVISSERSQALASRAGLFLIASDDDHQSATQKRRVSSMQNP